MSLSMASQCGSLTPRSRRRRGSLLDAGCSQRAASKHNRGKLNGREEMRFTHTTECERKPIQEYEIEYPAPRLRVSHSSRGASPPAETPVASLLPPPSFQKRKKTNLIVNDLYRLSWRGRCGQYQSSSRPRHRFWCLIRDAEFGGFISSLQAVIINIRRMNRRLWVMNGWVSLSETYL